MSSQRTSVFISHATTPIDSELTRWLALRLMREGYTVWCDLERLRVGDDFWDEIEDQIRNKTAKFVVMLSRDSITRDGVKKELGVASKIAKHHGKRFILPCRVDGLEYENFPIEANRLDAADFSHNWAVGLKRLLEILQEDSVPRSADGPAVALGWWQQRFSATEGVVTEQEEYASNRYDIVSAPQWLYLHTLDNLKPFEKEKFKPPYPVRQIGGLFISFASSDDLAGSFEQAEGKIGASFKTKLTTFLGERYQKPKIERREARNIVVRLLKLAFHKKAAAAGLLPYELANKESYFWFPGTVVPPRKKVPFTRLNGSQGGRALVGAKEIKDAAGSVQGVQQWHYGIEAVPTTWPSLGFYFRSHVAFSLNGSLYPDSKKQHRLRRRECKLWFNDRWGDMLQAAVTQLAGQTASLDLEVGKSATVRISKAPAGFVSPVRYRWEKDKELPPYHGDDDDTPAETEYVDDEPDEEEDDD